MYGLAADSSMTATTASSAQLLRQHRADAFIVELRMATANAIGHEAAHAR
jgi:hypothetical protein